MLEIMIKKIKYEKKELLNNWYTGWKYEIFFDEKYSYSYKESEIAKE